MAQPTQWAAVVSGLYGKVNWSVSPLPSLSSLNQEEAPYNPANYYDIYTLCHQSASFTSSSVKFALALVYIVSL